MFQKSLLLLLQPAKKIKDRNKVTLLLQNLDYNEGRCKNIYEFSEEIVQKVRKYCSLFNQHLKCYVGHLCIIMQMKIL